MSSMPLRYRVSSWWQLPECLSNNDRDLRIRVSDFIDRDHILYGFRISIVHPLYGVLFAHVLNARGSMITPLGTSDTFDMRSFELDTEQILQELRKFGFYITYEESKELSARMIEYLLTIHRLGFDKIRVLNVWSTNSLSEKEFKWYVVAFKTCGHGDWLNNSYSPSIEEFSRSLLDGTAINISDVSIAKGFNWSWLDYVANIEDIIRDNTDDEVHHGDQFDRL